MKAATFTRYGPPEVVTITDVEKPIPNDNEVLIRVHAASVNPLDCSVPRGGGRVVTGIIRPRSQQFGLDVAGTVESVGRAVTHFKPGDAVFGVAISNAEDKGLGIWTSQGAYAEAVCAPESMLVLKPGNVTFEQAASVPVAAFTALQGLRDCGHVAPGKRVLINGASGGVGIFSVQIAKAFGAEVTGVCSTQNLEMVRATGADTVIDYSSQDFTNGNQTYDLIFDCAGNHSLSRCRRILGPNGILVMVGDLTGRGAFGFIARLVSAWIGSKFIRTKMVSFMARPAAEDLVTIRDLISAGSIAPIIDRIFSLDDVSGALRYVEGRRARGKVVISLAARSP
jgi:NADPH:quinone reductase-like Zn-dependent oxidoreductase